MTNSTSGLVDLILVRHGETAWNVRRMYTGQADPPLSGPGWSQAVTAAMALRHRMDTGGKTVIISSDLLRSLQTAALIGEVTLASGLWRELDFGTWTGLTYSQIMASQDGRRFRAWYDNPWDVAPPGGETLLMLMNRVAQGLIEAISRVSRCPGIPTVVVVTHGGPIRAVEAMLEGQPRNLNTYWSHSVGNGGYIHHRLNPATIIKASKQLLVATGSMTRQNGRQTGGTPYAGTNNN